MSSKRNDEKHAFEKVDVLPDLLPNGLLATTETTMAEQGLATDRVMRSTTDPLEINYADASLADGLQSKHTTTKVRFWAWLFLWLPISLMALLATFALWKPMPANWHDMRPQIYQFADVACKFLASILLWAVPIFWAVVLLRHPYKRK